MLARVVWSKKTWEKRNKWNHCIYVNMIFARDKLQTTEACASDNSDNLNLSIGHRGYKYQKNREMRYILIEEAAGLIRTCRSNLPSSITIKHIIKVALSI